MSESYIAKRANQNIKEGFSDLDPALKIAYVERQKANQNKANDKEHCEDWKVSLENAIQLYL